MPLSPQTTNLLRKYADLYETPDFLKGDPSWFMHQVRGAENQEAIAFIASCLSYGSRKQFLPKIQLFLDWSGGDIHSWVASGTFCEHFQTDDDTSFYRLYPHALMHKFLEIYRRLLADYGTLGKFVQDNASDAYEAIGAICSYFSSGNVSPVIPVDARSACKRVCMFLRWMVREGSPVDLGLWSSFIDRRSLIMPLDTHVLSQSQRLGLLSSKTASMHTAIKLTHTLAEVFPEDPLRGDFALFGYGVNNAD